MTYLTSLSFVIKLALILIFSILPSLIYLLIFQKAKKRWQTRLRRDQIFTGYRHHHYRDRRHHNTYNYRQNSSNLREYRRPVTKYFIGDTSCINNAHSPYIRCAINPNGPCNECIHYEKHESRS